ncbi:MAG: hypothetical protein JWR36_1099 [Glaciihabitans sp.]|jgi:hypothetical protein|nr:hypothetical protein [Glaciihabitans sp.]MDQ1570475.1 hypothetical protein [Actinomycetota bacterium]
MTDTASTPLQILGDATAAACDGDFCEIPEHHEQAIINARVDSNNI